MTGDVVELTVPYGANLLEVLAAAAEEGTLRAVGYKTPITDNDSFIGEYIVIGYSWYDADDDSWRDVTETWTMVGDLTIDQDYRNIGWEILDGGKVYYTGTEYLEEGWHYIEEDYDNVEGGAWYYFYEGTGDWSGYFFRAEGVTRVPYPTEAINGVTYAPNAEDLAYYNAHKSSSKYSDAESAEFYFDKDGKFLADFTGIVGDSYVVNGIAPWHVGFVEIDGEYYYFGGDKVNGGNVMLTGKVYTSRANGTGKVDGIYNFDVDGKLIGNYYGLYMYKGDVYYRRTSTGELATGWYYITVTNGIEGFNKGDKLYFGEDGKMTILKSGIVEENGKLYYYVNNTIKGAGLIEIDGDYYYVRTSTGEVVTGEYYITVTNGIEGFSAGQKCVFGTDGKLVK
jgi:hypothetical protein